MVSMASLYSTKNLINRPIILPSSVIMLLNPRAETNQFSRAICTTGFLVISSSTIAQFVENLITDLLLALKHTLFKESIFLVLLKFASVLN